MTFILCNRQKAIDIWNDVNLMILLNMNLTYLFLFFYSNFIFYSKQLTITSALLVKHIVLGH